MAKGPSKSTLMAELAEKTGLTRKQAAATVETLVAMACMYAKKSGECTLPGLGKLVKAHRAARMGRNPATGAQVQIPAKTVVKFRVAKAAKEAIL